jgi:ribosomal protein S18 acetylase RimI-like enzyme
MSKAIPVLKKLNVEQRRLLARRLTGDPADRNRIVPTGAAGARPPLSFPQQRLWFLDQLDPGNSAYNVYRAVRVKGSLDIRALEAAFNELVRRHETLRTIVRVEDGIAAPVICASPNMPLPVVDLSGLHGDQQEVEVLRLANEEAHRPFDLSRDLLLRATLLRVDALEHVLLVTTHHFAADGWSVGILFSDLSSLYEVFSNGTPSSLPELPIRYSDYAIWQRQRFHGSALDEHLAYWRNQLRDVPESLNLRSDRPRPVVHSLRNFRGARHYAHMPRQLLDTLTALSRQEGVTLFMTFLAGFNALLARYSGQDDIVVGSPIAGRNQAETEGLIGCFSNTLLLRTSLAGDPSFRTLLGRIRETALGAFAHQDMPFERIVEELRPRRAPNRTPLFQVNFRLQTAPLPPPTLANLNLTFLEIDNRMAKFDLAFELCARPDGIGGFVEYFTDLFDAATVRRMLLDYEKLLAAVAERPNAPLRSLRESSEMLPDSRRSTSGDTGARRGIRGTRRKELSLSGQTRVGSAAKAANAAASESHPLTAFELRKATMKDCAFLYHLRSITLERYVSEFSGWGAEQREAYYLDFDPSIHEIIAIDGQDAGAVAIVRKDTEIRFINLHLLPEYQSRGVGTAIFQQAITEADARRIPIVLQGVLKTNPAIRLYERLGFAVTEEGDLRYVMTRPVPRAESDWPPRPSSSASPSLRAARRKTINLPSA